MRNKIKYLFAIVTLCTIALFTVTIPTEAQIAINDDCSTNGFCQEICGPAGNVPCTYADCGSGTQLCTKS